MSVNVVKAAAGAAQEGRKSFPQMLTAYKNHIAMALPKHMNADRMARIAMTCFRQNPKLDECAPESVFAAVIVGSQLGLEPGILGQAYLVPYKGECQFIPGWQGYVDLVSRAGRASVWTGAVYAGDDFDYELGDRPFLKHKPCGENDPGKLQFTYAIGRIKDAPSGRSSRCGRKRRSTAAPRSLQQGRQAATTASSTSSMYGRKVAAHAGPQVHAEVDRACASRGARHRRRNGLAGSRHPKSRDRRHVGRRRRRPCHRATPSMRPQRSRKSRRQRHRRGSIRRGPRSAAA
jgi:hypothetical protein